MSEVDFSPKWPLQPQKPMMPNSQRRLSQRKGCGEEMVRSRCMGHSRAILEMP
jgi:hypothetical protein